MTNHLIVMLRKLQASSKTFVYVYKILHFCANPQKFQTLVPAKNSHLKITLFCEPYILVRVYPSKYFMGCVERQIKHEAKPSALLGLEMHSEYTISHLVYETI